jgi:hypothetical protein
MPQNFVGADRDQVFLLPPSLRDWLPEDHLAWRAAPARDCWFVARAALDSTAVREPTDRKQQRSGGSSRRNRRLKFRESGRAEDDVGAG